MLATVCSCYCNGSDRRHCFAASLQHMVTLDFGSAVAQPRACSHRPPCKKRTPRCHTHDSPLLRLLLRLYAARQTRTCAQAHIRVYDSCSLKLWQEYEAGGSALSRGAVLGLCLGFVLKTCSNRITAWSSQWLSRGIKYRPGTFIHCTRLLEMTFCSQICSQILKHEVKVIQRQDISLCLSVCNMQDFHFLL